MLRDLGEFWWQSEDWECFPAEELQIIADQFPVYEYFLQWYNMRIGA